MSKPSIGIVPDKLEWNVKIDQRLSQKLTLTNKSDKDACYKIKTTHVERYAVLPGAAVIAAGDSAEVEIVLIKKDSLPDPDSLEDRFLIQAAFQTDPGVKVADFWAKGKAPSKDKLYQKKFSSLLCLPSETEEAHVEHEEAAATHLEEETIEEVVEEVADVPAEEPAEIEPEEVPAEVPPPVPDTTKADEAKAKMAAFEKQQKKKAPAPAPAPAAAAEPAAKAPAKRKVLPAATPATLIELNFPVAELMADPLKAVESMFGPSAEQLKAVLAKAPVIGETVGPLCGALNGQILLAILVVGSLLGMMIFGFTPLVTLLALVLPAGPSVRMLESPATVAKTGMPIYWMFFCLLYLFEDCGMSSWIPFYWLIKPILLVAVWGIKVAGQTVHGTQMAVSMVRK